MTKKHVNLVAKIRLFFDDRGRIIGRSDPVITREGRAALDRVARPAPPTGPPKGPPPPPPPGPPVFDPTICQRLPPSLRPPIHITGSQQRIHDITVEEILEAQAKLTNGEPWMVHRVPSPGRHIKPKRPRTPLPHPLKAWSPILFALVFLFICWILATLIFPPPQLPSLKCTSPWVVMSPGMPTAHDARVNLDQHGSWIILAPEWLVIWRSPDQAVAAHGIDAWDATVSLGVSSDPAICGFVNVIMGDRLIIPADSQLVEW